MKLLVTDTNIFFDLISIGALPEFFNLEADICTTELVINEIKPREQRDQIDLFLRSNKLTVYRFSADDIESIVTYQTTRSFKGITDKSVLWKAEQLKCPLLTGDKKLRNEAGDRGVEVHGTLWVIHTLVEQSLIEKEQGINFLQRLRVINSSLPIDKIDKMIRGYK